MQKTVVGGIINHVNTLHVTLSASFKGCMVAIRDAIYYFQSTLVKGKILAYVILFEN